MKLTWYSSLCAAWFVLSLAGCAGSGGGNAGVEDVSFTELQTGKLAPRRGKARIVVFPYEGREVPGFGTMWKRTGEFYLLNGSLFSADGVGFVWHDVKAGREAKLDFGGLDPRRPDLVQGRDRLVLTPGDRETLYLAVVMESSEPGRTVARLLRLGSAEAEERLFARVGHRATVAEVPDLP
ncbi:MAG: hypothetical protein SNJ52_01925 [Verrucomicrobiia bacterium]